ncbi:glutamate racemase [Sandaracinobacter sp. RS1-74]|uniref:glutamate racemase n=1 Tax=Sandaracinobacteroides sayramensis TaxID=2913411 RepID=UPI001EDB7F99|nr:glutamate racemase [Sandaracinobacteroides sayramensis]MCG2839635.1 glutamate racemase [Sandaracinobacteroides sayramensis]
MQPGPILFLDSGVGGLSILSAVATRLPDAPLVYCADSAGFPYGIKGEAEVSARVAGLLGRLAERIRPSLVVIACNTASTIALGYVRPVLDVPVVGTVPAIKPAAEQSETHVIGVLGTEATVRQPYVADLSSRFASGCRVLKHGAPSLVQAAEAKLRGEAVDPAVYSQALDGLLAQAGGDRLDMVVLACTHFPLVEDELRRAAPRPLRFIHGADGIARRAAHLLQGVRWDSPKPEGRAIFTGGVQGLDALRPALQGFGLTRLEGL